MERLILNFNENADRDISLRRVPMLVKMYESRMGPQKNIKIKFEGEVAVVYNKGNCDSVVYLYQKEGDENASTKGC